MDVDEEHRFTDAQEQNSPGIGDRDIDENVESPRKRRKLVVTGDQSNSSDASGEKCDTGVVFALDYSLSVSDEEFQKQFNFAKDIAGSLMFPTDDSKGTLLVYGDYAERIALDPDNNKYSVQKTRSKYRRMDLALRKAADNFNHRAGSPLHYRLVVLITAGRQLSGKEKKEDEQELLISTSELLSSSNIKVIIVPVGLETDFRELGLIVKRPQSLFPLSSFDDMTPDKAQDVASNIMNTIDIEAYAKETFNGFSSISLASGLWENISLCSDVIEGAWYLLYDDQTKPGKQEKIKMLIRESIDNFHSTLVTESRVCISLAVFGPLGAGKSFFLNFLLNSGLPVEHRVENGPLPSGFGVSQTPLPIYVKYGKNVKVLLRKQNKDAMSVVWFPEEELSNDSLTRVRSLLQTKFQEPGSLINARCIELQGPFPVFRFLKERAMTSTGHLELEVDVEFVDVPGCGDETGNESINVELSKADVVLFFDSGKSGRPVSSEDIAQIFRRREEFEFTSRPKLVHIVNDRREFSNASCNFDLLYEEKKENLNKAWSSFFASSVDDDAIPGCYKDVRAKLPQLSGEALLEKLSQESEVIYFHPENSGCLNSLKNAINDHVQSVKIKQTIHPFLQNVHWTAEKLKTRIERSLRTEKEKRKPVNVKSGQATFEMRIDKKEASELVTSFVDQTDLPLQSDIKDMYRFLYDNFLKYSEVHTFLLKMLKESLEIFSIRLMDAFMAANWSTLQDVPSDVIELVKMLCKTRVHQFCAHSAPAYLLHVIDKGKNRNPFGPLKKRWSSARSAEERKRLCHEFLDVLLHRTEVSLVKETRDKEHKKSHFHLIKQLNEVVTELLSVRSFDDACRTENLKLWHTNLQVIIEFCNKTIREINPHPSLDVQADISLPEKMVDARPDETIPSQSSHKKIIKEMEDLLLNSKTKGAVIIHKLETGLKFGKHGDLELPRSQRVDQILWAKALVNVLSDKDHFNIDIKPSLVLDRQDGDVEELLKQARERLFAHEKSIITCKIVEGQSLPENEIHLRKNTEEICLEALVSSRMSDKIDAVRKDFKDPSQDLAPIFIPVLHPGPSASNRGNYFLEEDPWSKDVLMDDQAEEGDMVDEEVIVENCQNSGLNVFLVVEPQHLETLQSTIKGLRKPAGRNLMYIVLPQDGRGIGVTRAIVKSLAECLKFSLYWTIDDDMQFMYQFDGNDRRWHKCSLTRGLLFGQRVFQTCLEKTVKDLSEDERDELFDDVTSSWTDFAKKTQTWRSARRLLIDQQKFAEVQKNPALLHSPFANISEDCGGDAEKEKELEDCERHFVDECRKLLFDDTVNHIAGISLAHEKTKGSNYMSKYPTADYLRSTQRHKVVLNNASALKGRNFVTDDVIFHDKDFQVVDKEKSSTPYWGTKGSDKSFSCALTVSGVISYQVVRIIHSDKKLRNAFEWVTASNHLPPLPPLPESGEESEEGNVSENDNS